MLFGALSPALAALTFDGRQDVLGRLLGAPVALDAASFCVTSPDDAHAHATRDDAGPHAAHDVYCLFCLASASTLALTAGPLPALAAHASVIPVPAPRWQTSHSVPGLRYARGPPIPLQHVR